jgi:sortase (surface protein transpeptidase)
VIGVWTPPSSTEAPVARPTVLRIPALSVLAPMVPLGLTPDGELAVPESEEVAGWWVGGSTPGRPGPSVVVGHVDSDRRPGVFQHLGDLAPGDEVEVLRDDGSAVRYTVDRVEQRAKADFPTDEVYGPTSASTLRLITCGGDFDRRSRHYLDNVIVYAGLAAPDAAS